MPEEFNPGQSLIHDLIQKCKEKITGQKHIAGYHCGPSVPILFAALGNTCKKEQMEMVRETIELAWNNIQGNMIILQYRNGLKKEEFIRDIDENIAKLRSAPEGIFKTYIMAKLFVFLDCDDERFQEYIDILNENIGRRFEQVQIVLVAMLNEKTSDKKRESRRKLSRLTRLKKEDKIQGLLVLSNVLRNGRILTGEAELNQYRIAADVAFLSNSYEIQSGSESMISREIDETLLEAGTVCTAAYIRLSKPSRIIARTALMKMIGIHEKTEDEVINAPDFDRSSHGFRKRLNSRKDEGPFGLEKLFREEVSKCLAKNIYLEDFPYFEQMNALRKDGVSSLGELENIMNCETMGVWKLFVELNYLNKAEEYLRINRDDICRCAKQFLYENFSYREILAYMEDDITRKDIMKDMEHIESGSGFSGNPQNVDQALYMLAAGKTRRKFYEEAGKLCREAFLEYYQEAKTFCGIVQTAGQLLRVGFVPNAVSDYYEEKVDGLFNYETFRKRMNIPCNTLAEYCSLLEEIFDRFAQENSKLFMASFEDELSGRISSRNATGTIILDDLGFKNKKLEDECRLEYGEIPRGISYCIAFAEAEFVKNLQENESAMGKVFKTSRQESVERIMLCSFSCDNFAEEGEDEV